MTGRLLLATVLAVSLLAGLAACGGDTPADQVEEIASEGAGAEAEGATEGEAETVADAAHGEELFGATCVACHGADATGVEGLGKDLHANEFFSALTDDEALAFLLEGRLADHELNTTGVAMPPKGGNPALTEADLNDITAFLRTLE